MSEMQKWEYLVLVRTYNSRRKQMEWADKTYKGKNGQELLNELGSQGWELVTTHVFTESIEEENFHYIFKRPASP
jgi:hypothetical protein